MTGTAIQAIGLLPPYVSAQPAARWATALLLAAGATAWVAVGVDLAELLLLARASAGVSVEAIERTAQVQTARGLANAQLLIFVATAGAFLIWLYQARVNLRAFGVRRLSYARSWVVAGFLIPAANLFRPYQVANEVWRASDPASVDPFLWRELRAPRLVLAWWCAFLAYALLELLAQATDVSSELSFARLQMSAALRTGADIAAGGAAGLGILLVRSITEAQEEKWEHVRCAVDSAEGVG